MNAEATLIVERDQAHAHTCESCGSPVECGSIKARLGDSCDAVDWYLCAECDEA